MDRVQEEYGMKSVKPGRGPSAMNAFGSLAAILFGIVWTAIAFSISPLFSLFGVIFIVLGIGQFLYHLHNAKSEDRFSVVDITDSDEEKDPLNDKFGRPREERKEDEGSMHFCPYCGRKLEEEYRFCPGCGKEL